MTGLLVSDDAFDAAFKQTHIEEKAAIKTSTGGKAVDHMETLLLQSKQFIVKGV